MEFDTKTAAEYAGQKLDSLLERATRDTNKVIQQADIPEAVTYFAELRDTVKSLTEKASALQKHIDSISQDLLPTMFTNANVKSIKVDGVGRVTINIRWNASLLNKEQGFAWLRSTGNEGLIIETVNSQTLGAFAKDQTMAGKPLPDDVFKVGSSPYTSITKS
jgi:seryl-tRNA synthetase